MNTIGDTKTLNDITYVLVRPSSPSDEQEGRENMQIWQGPDGCCHLSLDETYMIPLPDCGEQS